MKKSIIIFLTYFAIPLSLIEVFSQFLFGVGYVHHVITKNKYSPTGTSLVDAGFHKPNQRIFSLHKTIYGDPTKTKETVFTTDKYGTIEPSSLEKAESKIKETVLFCGGSTTECYVVPEGARVPDIFHEISGIHSINASRSGKDLNGCVHSIQYILNNIGPPKAIIVANNINTLMTYPRQDKHHTGQPRSPKLAVKKAFEAVSPGIYTSLAKIKKKLKSTQVATPDSTQVATPDSTQVATPDSTNLKLPEYEIALSKGCCHGAASFNRNKESIYFDWNSRKVKAGYYEYVKSTAKQLKTFLDSMKYPLERVYIFIEPNSFRNEKTSGSIDYRQLLHDTDGNKLGALESSRLTSVFDGIYMNALKSEGFQILQIPSHLLKPEYFYDAAHLSPNGSDFVGTFYAENLFTRQSPKEKLNP